MPYTDAVSTSLTPTYDEQRAVYGRVQALLDSAIVKLAGAGAGIGFSSDPPPKKKPSPPIITVQ